MSVNSNSKLEVTTINLGSKHLEEVIALGDSNTATLGFMPRAAFEDYAAKELILGCITPEGECIGYLLYGISKSRIRLAHLCISQKYRGQGVAKQLLKHLQNKTNYLEGVFLSCRRDYNLERVWQALGFVARSERPGRGADRQTLTEWWLDYGHPTLFTHLAYETASSKMCAVIDANIFFDISDEETADEHSKESKSLTADWIRPELELYLTDEINNEVNRAYILSRETF